MTALGQITAAQDPTDWASAMEPFTLLLKLSLDPRPKVRRAAHGAVRDTLAALQALQAAGNACETVLKGEHSCFESLITRISGFRASKAGVDAHQ